MGSIFSSDYHARKYEDVFELQKELYEVLKKYSRAGESDYIHFVEAMRSIIGKHADSMTMITNRGDIYGYDYFQEMSKVDPTVGIKIVQRQCLYYFALCCEFERAEGIVKEPKPGDYDIERAKCVTLSSKIATHFTHSISKDSFGENAYIIASILLMITNDLDFYLEHGGESARNFHNMFSIWCAIAINSEKEVSGTDFVSKLSRAKILLNNMGFTFSQIKSRKGGANFTNISYIIPWALLIAVLVLIIIIVIYESYKLIKNMTT